MFPREPFVNGYRGNNSKCGEIFCKIPRSSLNSYPIGLKIGASEARLHSEWNTSLVEQNPPGFDLDRTSAWCVAEDQARMVDAYCS